MSESTFIDRLLGVLLARRAGQFAAGQQIIFLIILLGNQLEVYAIGTFWPTALLTLLVIMVAGSPIWLRTHRFYTPEVKSIKCLACGSGYYKTTHMKCDHCGSEWSVGKPP